MYAIAGVYSLSPTFLVASIKFGDAWNIALWVVLGLHGLWIFSFIVLFVISAWATVFRDFSRLDAWWWLSVPYAAGIFLCVLVLGSVELGAFLKDLLYMYALSLVSSFVWMVGAFRQMAIGAAGAASTARMVMLGGALAVLLAPVIAGLLGGI